jgi:F0F1-type ATP synthase assembly protein I
MPQSKSRHPHKHIQQQHKPSETPKHQKTNRSIIVTVIFFALIGLGISYFVAGSDVTGLIIGVIAGSIAGYIFAMQVNKSLTKK